MLKSFLVLLLLMCTVGGRQGYAAEPQSFNIAGINVAAWIPTGTSESPAGRPVIIVSHGFHECNTDSKLAEVLSAAGYAVFAPSHHDVSCSILSKWFQLPQITSEDRSRWTKEVHVDRNRDMRLLLDALVKDSRFSALDWKRVGLAGHALGGYTVMGSAGGWPELKDDRIKAVLAIEPYVEPFVFRQTLRQLNVPVMYQELINESGVIPAGSDALAAYVQSSSPRFYVVFTSASTDMEAYGLAFFDRYLRNKPFPEPLVLPHQGIPKVQIDMRH
jgi:predicted dienelactone hydrolase